MTYRNNMKIGILISKQSWEQYSSVDRLEEAAKELGHETVRLYEPNFLFCSPPFQGGVRGGYLYDGKPLPKLDVILPRPNFIEEPSLHMHPIHYLNQSGFKLINSKHHLGLSKNKIRQLLHFQNNDIPHPESAITKNPEQALVFANQLGFPVIIKIAFGTHGKGVFYAPDKETFQPIAEYLAIRDHNPIIVQRFVKEAERKDVRAFVIGNKVIAAMERSASSGDIRANTSTGGTGKEIELSDQEKQLAVKVAKSVNLEIAGVDLIRSESGPLVLEVNANPGFKALEEVTGKDIAKKIIEFSINF